MSKEGKEEATVRGNQNKREERKKKALAREKEGRTKGRKGKEW